MESYIRQALMDEDAMVRLLEEIEPMVYRISYYLTHHQQDAEDIAQEALYKVCTKLSTYRGQSSFQTWVYALVMNTFKDFYRKRQQPAVESLQDDASTASFEATSDAKITVRQLLRELPETDRQILILRFQSGLSVKEVAEIVKMSQANVKTKVFRIKQRLQILLGGDAI